jgi:hypothetical protein
MSLHLHLPRGSPPPEFLLHPSGLLNINLHFFPVFQIVKGLTSSNRLFSLVRDKCFKKIFSDWKTKSPGEHTNCSWPVTTGEDIKNKGGGVELEK